MLRENEIRRQVLEVTAQEIAGVLVQQERSKWCPPTPENWDWEKEPDGVVYLHNALQKICE